MSKRPTGPPEIYYKEAREHIRMFHANMGPHPIVLEIGCNDGMHTKIFLEEIPDLHIFCFEPDERPLPRFREAVGNDLRVTFQPLAIAAKTGLVPWFASGGTTKGSWLSDWDMSGSIRRPTGHLKMSPWVTFKDSPSVLGVALDDWMINPPRPIPADKKIDLVFADVQGAEGDMIAGGQKTFAERVRYLWTEFYETPMYQGQPNLQQILEMLPGYEVVAKYQQDVYLHNRRLP